MIFRQQTLASFLVAFVGTATSGLADGGGSNAGVASQRTGKESQFLLQRLSKAPDAKHAFAELFVKLGKDKEAPERDERPIEDLINSDPDWAQRRDKTLAILIRFSAPKKENDCFFESKKEEWKLAIDRKHYFRVVYNAGGAPSPDTKEFVHTYQWKDESDHKSAPDITDFLGSPSLCEVVLDYQAEGTKPDAMVDVRSRYDIVETANPILAQAAAALQKLGLVPGGVGVKGGGLPPRKELLFGFIGSVDLPTRCIIQVTDTFGEVAGPTVLSSNYTNTPLTRTSFGLVAGVVLTGADAGRQAKVNGTTLAANTLAWTAQSWVVANFRLKPLDTTKTTAGTGLQRVQFFGGAAVGPQFGACAGLGVTLSQGLSLNAGWSYLVFDQLRPGDVLGKPPSNAANPLRQKGGSVFFVGFGYAVQ
jgi:hypothetical protein